jgi:hypothetical protein
LNLLSTGIDTHLVREQIDYPPDETGYQMLTNQKYVHNQYLGQSHLSQDQPNLNIYIQPHPEDPSLRHLEGDTP